MPLNWQIMTNRFDLANLILRFRNVGTRQRPLRPLRYFSFLCVYNAEPNVYTSILLVFCVFNVSRNIDPKDYLLPVESIAWLINNLFHPSTKQNYYFISKIYIFPRFSLWAIFSPSSNHGVNRILSAANT